MKAIICDTQSVEGRFFIPGFTLAIEKSSLGSETKEKILTILRNWKFETTADCRACGLYRLSAEFLTKEWKVNTNALYAFMTRALIKNDKKKIDEVAAAAKRAWDTLAGEKNELPTWGELHRNYFRHTSEDRRFYTDVSIPTEGDDSSVNPGSADWTGKVFEQTAGASQRMIVELSVPPKALVQLSGVNEDVEDPPIESESGAWKRWSRCDFSEVRYPYEWSNTTPLHF